MMSCAFCGKDTGIAIDQRMGKTKQFNDPNCLTAKGTVPDMNGCDDCQKLFKEYKYFAGECGHSGFIKEEALEHIFKPEALKELEGHKIFRMDKCFQCQGLIPADKVEHIGDKIK